MNHWLGKMELPVAADKEFCDQIYPLLRKGSEEAKKETIRRYMRLVFKICCRYSTSHRDTDELVAEGFYTLVKTVDSIASGSIDHHVPSPNIGGYINVMVYGSLNKLIVDRNRVYNCDFIGSQHLYTLGKNPLSIIQDRELITILYSKISKKDQEVMNLSVAGYTDAEVANKMLMTRSNVTKIRTKVRELLEILDDEC